MTALTDAERDELRSTVRRFLAEHAPLAVTRCAVEVAHGYDLDTWTVLTEQLGLATLPVPEDCGGAGADLADILVVLEELGRALTPSPYFASLVLAAGALDRAADDDGRKEWVPQLASGELRGTLAAFDEYGRWAPAAATVAVRGGALTGFRSFVLDGESADLVLVPVPADAGVELYAVTADAAGLTRTPLPTLDLTRRQARLEFRDTPATLVGRDAAAGLADTFEVAALALAAEQLGGAQRCLEMARSYALERVAFGRPIGGFQAIKHKLADLLVEVEFARSAVARAAAAEGTADFGLLASLAAAHCSDMYAHVATEALHVHGGIGFTWEHDAHLYFKRAKSAQVLLGDATFHRERIAAALLDEGTQP